jgi:F-type H+-transporting ATPase subunit c
MKNKIIPVLAILAASAPALAEEAAATAAPAVAAAGGAGFGTLGLFAAGIGMGLAALGGAFGQGKIAAAAMEGIGRNPQSAKDMFTPMLIGLVFVETLVLFTFVMSILLSIKF